LSLRPEPHGQGALRRTPLKQGFDRWIDIGALNDIQAAAKIREAGIDILVNLNGYFGEHRMDVFASVRRRCGSII
jgi:protein O-GlcNAc transferase